MAKRARSPGEARGGIGAIHPSGCRRSGQEKLLTTVSGALRQAPIQACAASDGASTRIESWQAAEIFIKKACRQKAATPWKSRRQTGPPRDFYLDQPDSGARQAVMAECPRLGLRGANADGSGVSVT